MANIRSRTPIPPEYKPDYCFSHDTEIPSYHRVHNAGRRPWKHMADTYVWVEHHRAILDPRRKKTEKWVLEQQILYPHHPATGFGSGTVYEEDPKAWMRREDADGRSTARSRESEKAKMIQEELKRIENRIRHRRESERRRVAAERERFLTEMKQREQDERFTAENALREAWRVYEDGWRDVLAKPAAEVTFSTIPWPLATKPRDLEGITSKEIQEFLMSPLHSERLTAKERIRKAQLRWHPDRFRRILDKVREGDKGVVEEGSGIVARCLNDMMAVL